ncbi:MAG: hypothetical protein ACI8UO_006120 [Verrucomicrobiales bacterium]|jgi:hypothetical protein
MKFTYLKFGSIPAVAAALFAGITGSAIAGEVVDPEPIIAYEAGRGLLTTEGPSGMFINPTSGTLPGGAFTVQWCAYFPNQDDSVVGHGWMAAYGVTDWLEIGSVGTYIDNVDGGTATAGGPMARIRLLKDGGGLPQTSIGYYGKYGDFDQSNVFGAIYKRFSIGNESGFVKSVGFHAGARARWESAKEDEFRGYGGLEFQLPYRLYIVGELTTEEDADVEAPFSYGIQWRAGGVNISLAKVQNGGAADGAAFYVGIGSAVSF